MKKIVILISVLCLAMLSACVQAQEEQAESTGQASSWNQDSLPAYLLDLADWEKAYNMECFLTRDDTGIGMTPSPMLVSTLAECLLEMGLTPAADVSAALEVTHPFTLTFYMDGKEERITVTNDSVTLSGVKYTAANPGALAGLFADEHERFLTGDIYLLREDIPFSAGEVAEVRLEEYENYSDGVTRVTTTDREAIEGIVQGLSETVARRFEADEEPSIFEGVGGNGYFCTLVGADGSEWTVNPRGLTTVTSPSGQEDVLVLSMDHEAVFGLLSSTAAVPMLLPRIDGVEPIVYEKAYETESQQKSMSHIVPVGMLYFDNDSVLPPQETYTCRLEWTDAAGSPVTPTAITATLYRETGDPVQPVDAGTPLLADNNILNLPAGEGKGFVVVRAELSDSSWVEHIFSYRSSIFPTAFYDISYGNDMGNVTLTRTDTGVSVTGTQNRKYVNFALDLKLTPATSVNQGLSVQNPFSMTFAVDGGSHELILTEEGAVFDNQAYTVGNPQAIEELYAPFEVENLDMFESIDYDLRGFLTKDITYFLGQFPLNAGDIETFAIIQEEPEQRFRHDMSGMDPQQMEEILGYVVLGKDWRTEDYYSLRRFYLSYELTLKDGTTYTIGEKVLKDGMDTGWYTIQSDSPLAAEKIEGKAGVMEQRDIPIRGGIGMDDAGNIIID